MRIRTIGLVIILIISVLGCKSDVVENQSQEKAIDNTTITTIPSRPSEIEVIDLTGEVDLFVVVAGAYSSPAAAQKKADMLIKSGFANADVIQRPGSNLYSTLVERFDSESEATAFTKELVTNNEIKSYVYKLDE